VYTAGLLVESAHRATAPDSPAASRLEKAMEVLNDAIAALRRNLVEMRPAAPPEALPAALGRLATDPRFRSLVEVDLQLNLPASLTLPAASTEHVLAIVSEALSNVVRHARARQVGIGAAQHDGRLVVVVQDDGQGLGSQQSDGFGLRNMRDRARLLGGELRVGPAPGRGTRLELSVPLDKEG
jgi:signal transduction histidine kinase